VIHAQLDHQNTAESCGELVEESKQNKGVTPQLGAGERPALPVSLSKLQKNDVLLSCANLLTL
jgi:hypothetical protein